jgi:hypothetical protein
VRKQNFLLRHGVQFQPISHENVCVAYACVVVSTLESLIVLRQELFLYPKDEEEGYMHEASSNNNYRSPRTPAPEATTYLPSTARKNKQFQGYQTIMQSGLKHYGDAYSVQRGGGGSGSGGRGGGSSGSGVKGMLQPDEALVQNWQRRHQHSNLHQQQRGQRQQPSRAEEADVEVVAGGAGSQRKRKLIVLSDTDQSDEDGRGGRREGGGSDGKRSRQQSALEGELVLIYLRLQCTVFPAEQM